MKRRPFALLALSLALFATEPNNATRRWWAHVTALSNDSLQGRDTGSDGYRKAASYVVTQFEKNGLKPAGEHGYYQTVPLHEVRFRAGRSTVELARANGSEKLQWLRQISVPARLGTPESIDAPLVFAGSGEPPADLDLKGKILVQMSGGRGGAGGRGGRGGGGAYGNRGHAFHRYHRRPGAAALARAIRGADDDCRWRAGGTRRRQWIRRAGNAFQSRGRALAF